MKTKTNTLTAALVAKGYRPHPPSHVTLAAMRVDEDTVANAECESCGTVGLEYHAWHFDRSYRVVGKCKSCGHESEF